MTLLRVEKAQNIGDPLFEWLSVGTREVLNEGTFKRMIAIERKRTERSKEPFLLMLLEAGNHQGPERSEKALQNILYVLPLSIRETDVIGWYKNQTIAGVMFTGLPCKDKNSILSVILSKVSTTLRDQLTPDQFNQVSISFHFFPDDWDHENPGRPSNPSLYPDLFEPEKGARSLLRIKQMMDIICSALMLIFLSPLLLIIAVAIKASSKGPVLFRQERVGQYGRSFSFLKFRSMRTDNNPEVHKEYVKKLIAGEAQDQSSNGNGKSVYKLANDPRVTRLGKFLRRTSLDELPQLVNVLKGDMSLVGPRPAIPYELAAYQTWHRRRVLEVKPGITGLWQVTGRSRVKFDEMVRLDLRYATSWSPWLDIKILIRTPAAVIGGAGAC
jgi:lipopolysaccharide/colanic/teichoic acid biosynthesis glycosyltransferase